MLKKVGLASVLLVAGMLPAMAQTTCTAPIAPASVDGNTATKEQMLAGIGAANAFMAASATYQDCLMTDLNAQKGAAAAAGTPFDAAIEKAVIAKTLDNQAQKEKVGAEINAAVGNYKKLHPSG